MPIGSGFDPLRTNSPVISYTSLDAASLEEDLKTYAQTQFSDRWTLFQNNEFAVTLLKQQTYIGDMLAYNYNMGMGEVNPMTSVRRKNFRNSARAWNFTLRGPTAGSVDMLCVSDPALLPYMLEADEFRVRCVGNNIFMPSVSTLITDAEQSVTFVAGDLQDNELLGVSDGTVDQEFQLSEKPLIETTLEVTVAGVTWTLATVKATVKSTDEVFFLDIDDRSGYAFVSFGDGINGKVPADTAEIRASYKVGGGLSSNIAPYGVLGIETPVDGLLSVNNPLKAGGGDNAMTLRQAKIALPAQINTNDRGVTVDDFAGLLFADGAPAGIAKASSVPVGATGVLVSAVPAGGGALSNALKNEIVEYLDERKSGNFEVDIQDATTITVECELELWVKKNYRPDDVEAKVRALLITEEPDPETQSGLFDFDNVGLGGLDDESNPTLTTTAIQTLMRRLEQDGLQRVKIEKLRPVPQTKQPVLRTNAGNGTISNVTYPGVVYRREFRVLFTSSRDFVVYRRIVGTVTYLSDDRLVDETLVLGSTPDTALPLPAGTIVNPNRDQEVEFAIDLALTTGNTVVRSAFASGSLFGASAPRKEYYLEFQDGTGTITAPATSTTYTSSYGDVEFDVNLGSSNFSSGDYILFDVFPQVSDILVRSDELPQFEQDASGIATSLVTKVRQ